MPTDAKALPRSATEAGEIRHGGKRALSPPAERALAEAAARRANGQLDKAAAAPMEVAGRGGLDPTRYGDWEINGLASDF